MGEDREDLGMGDERADDIWAALLVGGREAALGLAVISREDVAAYNTRRRSAAV